MYEQVYAFRERNLNLYILWCSYSLDCMIFKYKIILKLEFVDDVILWKNNGSV
jgi:hypothetical protein